MQKKNRKSLPPGHAPITVVTEGGDVRPDSRIAPAPADAERLTMEQHLVRMMEELIAMRRRYTYERDMAHKTLDHVLCTYEMDEEARRLLREVVTHIQSI